jgi:exopolysaccharide biosynthesis polyprenyl glycosylphosphotransferase
MELSRPNIAAIPEPKDQFRNKTGEKSFLEKNQWKFFTAALIVSDLFMVAAAFRVAYFVRFEMQIPIFKLAFVPSLSFYLSFVAALTPIWIVIQAVIGLYNRANLLGGTQEYSLVFTSTTLSILVVIMAGFFGSDFVVARGWLVSAWVFAFVLVSLGRFIIRREVYHLRRSGHFLSPTLIVGANDEGMMLAEQLADRAHSGMQILGFVGDAQEFMNANHKVLPLLGDLDSLDEIIRRSQCEEIILVTSAISRDCMVDIFKQYGLSSQVNVRLSSGLYELITTSVQVREVASVPLVRINKVRLTGIDKLLKTILDYGLTIPGLILISPVMLLIAGIVKLDSPGPVIYRRKVMGVNGATFDAFKFRTMAVNGDEILARYPDLKAELDENHKLKDDPRVTRVGRILRKLSLDELPQLINVLMHQMSLVGPRIISPEEMALYQQWGTNLLTIRPGITGLWQVSGRSDVSYEERVRLDMYYIRKWTVWLDINLLARTIPAAIKGKGAY